MFIATIDVKKCIYHMACNKYDTQIAIVENQAIYESVDESVVRIYDVGRSRNEDETVSFIIIILFYVEFIISAISGGR